MLTFTTSPSFGHPHYGDGRHASVRRPEKSMSMVVCAKEESPKKEQKGRMRVKLPRLAPWAKARKKDLQAEGCDPSVAKAVADMEVDHAIEENEVRTQVEEEIENVADSIDAGFSSLEKKLDQMDKKFDQKFDQIEERLKNIPNYMQVLTIVGTVVTISVGIL